MKTFDLLDLEESAICFIFTYYALSRNYPFIVHNQTNGACCTQSEAKGIPVILNKESFKDIDYSESLPEDMSDKDEIYDWLNYTGLDKYFEANFDTNFSHEACIHLSVKDNCTLPELYPYKGLSDILTFENSD